MPLILSALLLSSIRAMAVLNPAVVVAAPAGGDAAAYAVIYNMSGADDRLVSVSCDCAERVEIHEMAGHGGARRMEVLSSLTLPTQRLVEIQPGGARHLMLINLRAPLVAGQTVSLSFRFEHGGDDTQEVAVVENTRAAWSAALAEEAPSRLTGLAFFAGSCWRGTFPDGRQTDTHCFSPLYNRSFLQDRHVVEGAPAPYSGETLYHYDVMGRSIHFAYHASDGSRSSGVALPTANGLSFPAETHRAPDGGEMTIRSTWTRDGADAYIALSGVRRNGRWRELWRMRMLRIGPTPPS